MRRRELILTVVSEKELSWESWMGNGKDPMMTFSDKRK